MFAWFNGSDTREPVLLRLRSSRTFIITTVGTGIFVDVFCYGILVPVLPFALTTRANIDPDRIQTWISIFLAVYGAALVVASPVFGWLADRMSARYWPLLLGLFALAGATVMLCVGNSIGILIAGRVLQGISGAVIWTVGLALLVDCVGSEGIGQAMGYIGISMSTAMLLAPLLGGIIFDQAGYYSVFALCFGLMALDIFLRVVMIEKKTAVKWLPTESPAPMEETNAEKTDPENVTSVELSKQPQAEPKEVQRNTSTNSAAVEALPESTPQPIKRWSQKLPPVIFLLSSRRLLAALWNCTMQATILTAFDSILPLFVRDTFDWNSTGAGLVFLPIVVTTLFGPVVGYLSDKHGPRLYAVAGFVLGCPCLILLRLVTHNTLEQKVLLCALLALIGLSLTLALTPLMAEITYTVDGKAQKYPPGHFGKNGAYAQAYSLFNCAWATGCLFGPLLGGLVNQVQGWGTSTLSLGCVAIFSAIPAAIWTGGSIFKKRKARKEGNSAAETS